MKIRNIENPFRRWIFAIQAFAALALLTDSSSAATPYVMSNGNYSQDFANVAAWTDGFASGTGAAPWGSVTASSTGAIPDGKKTTTSTATFSSGASGGVQRGSGNIVLLSTGTTDNAAACAIELFLDFTGQNAGTLSFDWSEINNNSGDRCSSIRVYTSTDGTTYTELTGAAVLNKANNVAASGNIASIALPASFSNSATARIRFYEYNGSGGTTGSRAKLALDNVAVTSTPSNTPALVQAETAANGSGTVVPGQTVAVGTPVVAYSITRTSSGGFLANAAAAWSLTSKTGGIVDGDLVPAADGMSATFTPHAAGSAAIHAAVSGLTSVDSGVISATAVPTNPTGVVSTTSTDVITGQSVPLTVTVTPGANPTSTGLTVTGDLSAINGSPSQTFSGSGNTFTYTATIPSGLAGGAKVLNITITDAQNRSSTASLTLNVHGNLTIFHTNDTHARVTPHKWIVPQHTTNTTAVFEDVGGIAYMGGKLLDLTKVTPDALVLDGGDISEGNPVGDWNGPGSTIGSYGDGTIVDYYKMLHAKLKTIDGRNGRGLDAMVVGNHDIRDITYFQNMRAASILGDPNGFHLLSMNICNHGTHTPYYEAYTIVNVNGNKVGIVGYTTESADSPETDVNNLVDVVKCDWSSTDSTKIHFADIVNDLRNNQGCNMVFLLTHMGHSGLCTVTTANPTPILVDNAVAKLPEVVVSGHWHTYCETVWQPEALNYKTIFTEAGSFQHYVGELRVNGFGKYSSSTYYPLRNSAIVPDPDIATYLQNRKNDYNAAAVAAGAHQTDDIIGYTADALLLDNYMKWWSADEYPWSGNNTAGNWICDAVQWKATQLFGNCDLSLEAGGGVRSDIIAGPVKYTNIYETFPWPDDTIYLVSMTGQQIWNYIRDHNCDAALSNGWHVTASDGVPTAITYNGNAIGLGQTYKVAINNYMYLHDSSGFNTIDPNPQTSTYLARTALVDYTSQFTQAAPYQAGPPRYSLNTDFSGGYRAVVTMMNDADTRPSFDDGFIRLLSALPETLAHRGTQQVPTSLVNADGSVVRSNRLAENEWYRSYLGFKTGALHNGDIVEVWGKGSFFGGDPEFVDQEGVQSDGVEFKIVGHDDSLAQPTYFSSIGGASGFWSDTYKNHYVKFIARKTGANTVVDKLGNVLTTQDATAYALKTLPGNVNDLLVLTGVPTSESYALRFRCDSAALASSQGYAGFPPDSHVNSIATSEQTSGTLPLTATATVAPGSGQSFYTLEPIADAQVSSGHATTNYGTSTNLFIQSSSVDAFGNERTWLRFDLSSIPAGSTITSATLNLWCWKNAGAALPTSIYPSSTDSWIESGTGSLTWNNQPVFDGTALDTQTLSTSNTWYSWNATAAVQSEFAGDKTATLLVKAAAEGAADSTAPSYGFDSKEYSSTHPYLQVITPDNSAPVTLTQVQFYYRFSFDNTIWSSWAPFQTATGGNWQASFTYPNGYGYYEFYSVATDSSNNSEPAPPFADASVHYTFAATVSNLADSGATLNGTLNPNGNDTSVYFQYGTDPSYGQSTAMQSLGSGTASVPFNFSLSGLQSGSTYHYRLAQVTNGVTTYYNDQTFTTNTAVPALPLWASTSLALLLAGLGAGAVRAGRPASARR